MKPKILQDFEKFRTSPEGKDTFRMMEENRIAKKRSGRLEAPEIDPIDIVADIAAIPLTVGRAATKQAIKRGTRAVLKNAQNAKIAYYNNAPWTWHPDPAKYYRAGHGREFIDDVVNTGEIAARDIDFRPPRTPGSGPIILKKSYPEGDTYWAKGAPLDGRYGSQYYGDHIIEASNDIPFVKAVNQKTKQAGFWDNPDVNYNDTHKKYQYVKPRQSYGIRNGKISPSEGTPLEYNEQQFKLFEPDWLRGYKEIPKKKNGGKMQEHQPNFNNSSVSVSEGFVGQGYDNTPRRFSPAWGGQFQDGGDIPIDTKIADLKGMNFYKNWMSQRQSQLGENMKETNSERLAAFPDATVRNIGPSGVQEETNIQNKRAFNATTVPFNIDYSRSNNPVNTIAGGYFDSSNNTIGYNGIPTPSTALHERTHAATNDGWNPQSNIISKVIPRKDEYWDNSQEVYGRLMEFRMQNKLDPTKTYQKEDLQNLRQTGKDTNLLKRYDDDQMLFLLNKVAGNKQQAPEQYQGIPSAQDGIKAQNIPEVTVYGKASYNKLQAENEAKKAKFLEEMGKYEKDSAQWVKAKNNYQKSLKLYNDSLQAYNMSGGEEKDIIEQVKNRHENWFGLDVSRKDLSNIRVDNGTPEENSRASINNNESKIKSITGISPSKRLFIEKDYPEVSHDRKVANKEDIGAWGPFTHFGVSPIYDKPKGTYFEPTQPIRPTNQSSNIKYDPRFENLNLRQLWPLIAQQDTSAHIGTLRGNEFGRVNDSMAGYDSNDPNYERGFSINEASKFPEEIRKKHNIDMIVDQLKKKKKMKDGGQLQLLDNLVNFTNYNTKQPGGWLEQYSK
jgi:hypothetical protein